MKVKVSVSFTGSLDVIIDVPADTDMESLYDSPFDYTVTPFVNTDTCAASKIEDVALVDWSSEVESVERANNG